jgi:hypothetical protein
MSIIHAGMSIGIPGCGLYPPAFVSILTIDNNRETTANANKESDMTNRENMEAALEGAEPSHTPLSVYDFFFKNWPEEDRRRLVDMGLVPCMHKHVFKTIEHGVENHFEEKRQGTDVYAIRRKTCPAGALQMVQRNGWHHEDWIKEPADYKIRQWMIEHTEVVPDYESWEAFDAEVGAEGIPLILGNRSPLMSINIDWAGTQQFCLDAAMEVEELFALYEAQRKLFRREIEIIADAPGRYVKWFENLTISMIGHERYRDYLMNIYEECVPILHQGGKKLWVHYDGELSPIADQIANAPFDGIESLTEPPEGDMKFDECRRAWPDKHFWANINVELYNRPEGELRDAVTAMRERAGKKNLCFEISEDAPRNWRESLPVVLQTLRDLG